jgi:MFS superfamily sulfate permease-like transporter
MDIFKGIRPLDYVLAAVMVTIAGLIGYENVQAGADADLAHALSSQSPWMIPVFVLAALPILWRRRNILAVIGVSFVITAASVPMFGWVTRCGWALPLSIAMAYAVARFAGSRQNQLIGLVGVLALQIVTLVQDASTGGLDALVLSVPAAALFYGLGLLVQSRASTTTSAPTLDAERVPA